MSWTDEREELLKQLWKDGLSCSQIAQRLGGVSRSAVIGKVHRLNLGGRTVVQRKPCRPSVRARPAPVKINRPQFAPRYVAAPSAQLPLPLIPPHERKTMLQLSDHDCRWPIGDVREPGFGFCGRPKVVGLPYCEPHCRVAFVPAQPVRRTPIVRPVEAPAEAPRPRVVEVA